MNRKIALSLLLAVTGASADDITMEPRIELTLTRAQVLHELQQSRESGASPWPDEYNPVAEFRSSRTREEATAEYIGSRDLVGALTGEDSGSMFLARREPAHPPGTRMAGDGMNLAGGQEEGR